MILSKLEFEVWRLGAVRHQDECLERYARVSDAVRALTSRQDRAAQGPAGSRPEAREVYEVRRLGVPIEEDERTPPSRRGTQPRLPNIRESSPSALRSTYPDDDSDAELA